MDTPEHRQTERPVGDLVKDATEQAQTLVRQEVELAKAELALKGKQAGMGAGMFGGAGTFGWFALGALTAAAIGVVDLLTAFWLAALIVAVIYGAIAGALALTGKKKVEQATPPVPERAVETTKEDVRWTKERAQAGRN